QPPRSARQPLRRARWRSGSSRTTETSEATRQRHADGGDGGRSAMNDDDSQRRQGRGSFKSTLITRFLTPIAAAGASAAAGYAAKKAPDFFEKTVLPRLKAIAGDNAAATGV